LHQYILRNFALLPDPTIAVIIGFGGFTITPDLIKRVDFERIECPKCVFALNPVMPS
jgi:hypothetical protein